MDFKSESWYQFLDDGMRDLVSQSYGLFDREKRLAFDGNEARIGKRQAPNVSAPRKSPAALGSVLK